MTKEEKIKELELLQMQDQKIKDIWDSFYKMFGGFEGNTFSVINSLFDSLVKKTAKSIGISEESLKWFVHENEFGKSRLACFDKDQKKFEINSIESFLEFEELIS